MLAISTSGNICSIEIGTQIDESSDMTFNPSLSDCLHQMKTLARDKQNLKEVSAECCETIQELALLSFVNRKGLFTGLLMTVRISKCVFGDCNWRVLIFEIVININDCKYFKLNSILKFQFLINNIIYL